MNTSENTDKILPALFKVKQQLGPVGKKGYNPHFRSKFADLNTHIELLEPVLENHGLFLMQPTKVGHNGITSVVTTIIHAESGQWASSELALTPSNDMQKVLAAITYARRGSLNSFFGLATVDDDGETAVGRGANKGWDKKPDQGTSTASKLETSASKPASSSEKKEVKGFTRQAAKSEVESKPTPVSNGAAKKGVIF